MNKLKALLKLIRPKHYIKNVVFVFAPIFFALKFTEIDLLIRTFLASIIFYLFSAVVYIVNDLKDIEEDKNHPKKRFRPLAAGTVTPNEGIVFAVILLITAIAGAYLLNPLFAGLGIGYFVMNLAYSFKLKHIALLDIFILSLGFVFRVLAGGIVTGIAITNWIIIMVFLLALFLALAKRRDDVVIFNTTGQKMRKSIDGYNLEFLNTAISVVIGVIIVAYLMYTTNPEIITKFNSQHLYVTSIFVMLGMFRYLQASYIETKGGFPIEMLLTDRILQLSIVGWIITFGLLIYI